MDDEKGIGDVNSTERGSGARLNTGKAPLDLIPLWVIVESFGDATPNAQRNVIAALEAIGRFQCGGEASELHEAMLCIDYDWTECARVFDYGRKKYAEWNWAKGMPWSVPIACAARHIVFGMLNGEENDPESGLPHRGHVMCNLVMLITYIKTYPEGDDRPKGLI